MYTQFDGVRPFGVVLLVGGIDITGKHLFSTDPSGAYLGYKAVCEGKKSDDAMTQFTKSYTTDISLHQALELGFQTMKKITKPKFNAEMVEAAVIDEKTGYYKLSDEMLKKLVEKHSSE
jgi:proteasome alpha subunit